MKQPFKNLRNKNLLLYKLMEENNKYEVLKIIEEEGGKLCNQNIYNLLKKSTIMSILIRGKNYYVILVVEKCDFPKFRNQKCFDEGFKKRINHVFIIYSQQLF